MSHANAALTPRARLRLARLVVEDGWPVARAARTVRGVLADRETVGRPLPAGRRGRAWSTGPRRPHRSPSRTPPPLVRKIVHLRWQAAAGPGRDRRPARRAGLDGARGAGPLPAQPAQPRRPAHRGTDPPLRTRHPGCAAARRCEEAGQHPRRRRLALRRPAPRRAQPGRDPGQAPQPRTATRRSAPRSCTPCSMTTPASPTPRSTTTRPPPPPSPCCAAPWPGSPPAASPSSGSSPTTAPPTAPTLWRDTCTELGITAKQTRPYRPQTNGKIERFHRTLADGWAFARVLHHRTARRNALPAGYTSTTITGPTPPSEAPTHHPPDQPAWAVHLGSRPRSRAISIRCTSEVPSPISRIFASR